ELHLVHEDWGVEWHLGTAEQHGKSLGALGRADDPPVAAELAGYAERLQDHFGFVLERFRWFRRSSRELVRLGGGECLLPVLEGALVRDADRRIGVIQPAQVVENSLRGRAGGRALAVKVDQAAEEGLVRELLTAASPEAAREIEDDGNLLPNCPHQGRQIVDL